MESFKVKKLKSQLDRIFGTSPQVEDMKNIILKANTTGFTEEEIEQYKKQKEEEINAFNAFFGEKCDLCLPTESVVIENKIFSNEILDDNTNITRTIGDD